MAARARLGRTGETADHRVRWRIPHSTIGQVENDTVHLTIARGQALAKGWQQVH